MLTIRDATDEDVIELDLELCEEDAAELRAAGLDVHESLEGAIAQALVHDGVLIALFGVVKHPAIERGGIPWMLCTRALHRVPRRAMADISRAVVAGWFDGFDSLSNLVHRRNARAVRFVRWLGFTVGAQPCGPRQEFYLFEWRRECATR